MFKSKAILCLLTVIGIVLQAKTKDVFFDKKKTYAFTKDPIDVVIPCCQEDVQTLDQCIDGIRKNGENIRRVIVVSEEELTKKAEWFNETRYPFSKQDIHKRIFKNDGPSHKRIGWIYQQLLKLYAFIVIPGISSNVLFLDSDTIFLNPVSFYDQDSGAGYFNPGTECHEPYFKHASRLIHGFEKVYSNYSGISHHMLMQLPILEDLFLAIEMQHKKKMWQAFCDCIDVNEVDFSCASEYEIYFNFVLSLTDQCKIRTLKWKNLPLRDLKKYKEQGYHYVSCHRYRFLKKDLASNHRINDTRYRRKL